MTVMICASLLGRGKDRKKGAAPASRRERSDVEGAGLPTHADSSLGAGVRSAVTEEAPALFAGLQLGAAVAALAGTHQTAGAVVQHRSHPGGAGRRRLGAPGGARVWAALSRSDLKGRGRGEKEENLSAGSIRQSDPAGRYLKVRHLLVPRDGGAGKPGRGTAWAD